MATLMDEAMAAVQGKGNGMRGAFLQLLGVYQRAEGQEKEEIGSMFEALQSSATAEDLAWMGDAWEQAAGRGDAAEEGEEEIDWERVNREAAAIVELNKPGRARWREQEGQGEDEGD
jgi:hypothetical protein